MVRLIRQLECIGLALKKTPQFQEKLEATCCCQGICINVVPVQGRLRVQNCLTKGLRRNPWQKRSAASPVPFAKKAVVHLVVCWGLQVFCCCQGFVFLWGFEGFLVVVRALFSCCDFNALSKPESGCSTLKKCCLHSRMDLNETK